MEGGALFAGLLLPWLLGIGVVLLLRPAATAPGAPGEIAWTAGAGYLAGAFLLTAWMRALSLAGIRFGVVAVAAPLAVATVVLFVLAWRRYGRALPAAWRDALRDARARAAARGRRPRRLVGGGRVDRAAVRAARRRDRVAPALPVGRVDAVGDQGARLVRTGISRAVRARQRVAGRRRHRLLRRIARVSADDAAPAGRTRASGSGGGTTR